MNDEIFRTHIVNLQPKLHSFAWKILGDECTAEDIVQDIFVYLYGKRMELDGIKNFEAYVLHICKCRCIDHLRRKGREKTVDNMEFYETAQQEAESERRCDNILKMMERLPEMQRRILMMKYVEGQKTEQIGQRINISPANVRTNLSRAYGKLRNWIKEEEL